MRRLVSTIGLEKTEWLRYRKGGITGTDAGAITGMNPYVSAFQVYQDKISDTFSDEDNESMRQGRDLEEYVAERFCEATGLKVRKANGIYQNEDHPIMLADFDRLIVGQKAGLECKTVSPYSSDKWKEDAIPLHYQMQVQHYLAVSGFDCWYIAALIFGKDFIVHKIERDEELINNLISIEEYFWNNYVVPRNMPDPDGTERCSELISKMYGKAEREKEVELYGFKDALERRGELIKLIEKLDREKSAIEQKIKLEMQEASYANADGYKISWTAFDSRRLDTKKLKEEQPDIFEKFSKTTTNRRFTINKVA